MTKHPANSWEWNETIEVEFQKWFNSISSQYFLEDCEVGDVNTRKDLMCKWLHYAYLNGFNNRIIKTNGERE
jgi:hypothetical protein